MKTPYQVRLELVEVHIEGAVETQGSSDRRNDLERNIKLFIIE